MAFMGVPWPMKMTGIRREGAAAAACDKPARDASAAVAPTADPMRKPRRPGAGTDVIGRDWREKIVLLVMVSSKSAAALCSGCDILAVRLGTRTFKS
ncbi:hypothetical protein J2W34_001598 [Variovorax boronicumulans]|nr:hypothetical protein [Variovorax boronicumulans]